MIAGIRSSQSVGVAVASAPRACRIAGIVTGCAAFRIPSGRSAVIAQPCDGRMKQWDPILPFMAGITKRLIIMAAAAVETFAFCIQSMSIEIVQVVDLARQIIPAVAFDTGFLMPMTLRAPFL